jgi:hypothetical protein
MSDERASPSQPAEADCSRTRRRTRFSRSRAPPSVGAFASREQRYASPLPMRPGDARQKLQFCTSMFNSVLWLPALHVGGRRFESCSKRPRSSCARVKWVQSAGWTTPRVGRSARARNTRPFALVSRSRRQGLPDDRDRLRDLDRAAARSEKLYWQEADGEPVLVDRYHRPLAQVKAELALALDLAEQLGTIVSQVETLTAGRVYGPTLPRRLRSSIETLVKLGTWNARVIDALEAAWREEQEKRAR